MKGLELNNKTLKLKSIAGQLQMKYLVKTLFPRLTVIVSDNEKHHNKENH